MDDNCELCGHHPAEFKFLGDPVELLGAEVVCGPCVSGNPKELRITMFVSLPV